MQLVAVTGFTACPEPRPTMALDPQTVDEFPLEAGVTASDRRRGLFFLGVAAGCMGFFFAIQMDAYDSSIR